MRNYILDENNSPVIVDDIIEWAESFGKSNRRVGLDIVDGFRISTVFLGLDHSFTPEGPPLIFETMIFKGDSSMDLHTWRYSTWSEAERGHQNAIQFVKDGLAGESEEEVDYYF